MKSLFFSRMDVLKLNHLEDLDYSCSGVLCAPAPSCPPLRTLVMSTSRACCSAGRILAVWRVFFELLPAPPPRPALPSMPGVCTLRLLLLSPTRVLAPPFPPGAPVRARLTCACVALTDMGWALVARTSWGDRGHRQTLDGLPTTRVPSPHFALAQSIPPPHCPVSNSWALCDGRLSMPVAPSVLFCFLGRAGGEGGVEVGQPTLNAGGQRTF